MTVRNRMNSVMAGGMIKAKNPVMAASINSRVMMMHRIRLRSRSLYWKNVTMG